MTTAAPSATAAVAPNKVGSGIELKNPAVQPASRFPSQFDKKNTPIMRLTILVGASLVTALKPTGLRQSSPISSIVYAATGHSGLTLTPAPLCAKSPAGTSRRNASPAQSKPIPNFVGLDGSRGPRRTHSQAITGASAITIIGCTDWSQEDGIT